MSVTSTDNQVIYTGSGTTGPFDFDFKIFASTDLKVEKYTIATDTSTLLTETTDYTVTIDVDGTGSVTTIAAVTSSFKLVITRELPLTQAVEYEEGDKFPSVSHEEALDRAAMRDQQLQEQIDRCVKVIAGSPTTPDDLIDNLTTLTSDATAAASAAEAAQTAAEAAAANFEFASQAEAEAGTNQTKSMNPLRTAQAIAALASSVNAKVVSTTYDLSTTGSLAVTGVGFTPKALIGRGLVANTSTMSWGMVSATTAKAIKDRTLSGDAGKYSSGNYLLLLPTGVSDEAYLVLASFDPDGFTLTKSKAGSPTGTGELHLLAIG
jgi:hypothetical protein